jgi:NADPH2:quinone reductase
VRAIVYTGTGGREVMGFEERPDLAPGSAELLVAVRFPALNTAHLAQRAGVYPASPGAPQDIPELEVAGRVVELGAEPVLPDDAFPAVQAAGGADVVLELPAEDAADAFDHMAGTGKFGKVLLAF